MSNDQTLNAHEPLLPSWSPILFAVICLSFLAIAIFLVQDYQKDKTLAYDSAKQELQELTFNAAGEINDILAQAKATAELLADDLSTGKLQQKNMLAALKEKLIENQYFFGGSITFRPYGFEKDRRLYSAYYSKSGEDAQLEFMQLEEIYDYTLPDYDWYVKPMAQGDMWGEPYWDEAGRTFMITYSALFYSKDDGFGKVEPLGVVTIDISMAQVRNIIESLNIGPSGFGALTTQEGNYLYHPNYDYVLKRKNIRDVAYEKQDENRLLIARDAAKLKSGILDHVSTTTGQESWLIYEPVMISGWSLQNTFIKEDIDIDVDAMRHQLIWILVVVMLAVIAALAFMLRIHQGNQVRGWWFAALVSLTLVIGIGMVWHLALSFHDPLHRGGIKIADKGTLQNLISEYRQESDAKKLAPPVFVPTGLQIEAMEFRSAIDIIVSGLVWQKYDSDFPKEIQKGIQFAHAKGVRLTEVDRQLENGTEVIQWRFQGEFRVQMDYSRYPLEVERIGMELRPLESDANIFLVPDLDAYTLITSTLLPGLDKDVFIPGWKLTESLYSFQSSKATTDFGMSKNFDQNAFPALHYEIGLKRIFVDAFISNLTPLIVVLIVLFALALLAEKIEIGRVLSICVALFFVVVFSHLDIRKHIALGEIFYLEYFFFIVYLAIILVPLNALRLAMEKQSALFDYQDGLIPKVIYWPSILLLFFGITVYKFY